MIRKAPIAALVLAITACAQNQTSSSNTNKAPYPFAAYKLIWGTDPGFEAPNPNKLYKPGQKIRAAAPDYNHDGMLAMDRVYFVGVDRRLTGPPDPGGRGLHWLNGNPCASCNECLVGAREVYILVYPASPRTQADRGCVSRSRPETPQKRRVTTVIAT